MNNILVPRNLEGRKDKLRQHIIKLLSQEVIEGDLIINVLFMDIPIELIKVKEIKGSAIFDTNISTNFIPSWLKDVKVHETFDCSWNDLTSLENCPQYVGNNFWCNNNNLTSLEGCPKYVGGCFDCSFNKLTSLEHISEYIGDKIYND